MYGRASWATKANILLTSYAIAWALEGAVRKWVPGMGSLGALLRDALLILVVVAFFVAGAPRRRHPWWPVLWIAGLVLGLHGLICVILGTTTPYVTLLGLRAYLAPLLVLVFAATYADSRAIEMIRTAISAIAVVNLTVVVLQVTSPRGSPINQEISGEAAYFVTSNDVVRATGTFAAPSGLSAFLPIAFAFALGGIVEQRHRRTLHILAALACVTMTVLGGSRAAVVSVAIVAAALVLLLLFQGTWRSLLYLAGAASGLWAVVALVFWAFPTVVEAFGTRIELASGESTDGRVTTAAFGFLSGDFEIVGHGAGSHSTAGFLQTGQPWVETEKTRWVAELGVIGFGLACVALAGATVCLFYAATHLRSAPATRILVLIVLAQVSLSGGVTQQPTTQGAIGLIAVTLWLGRSGGHPEHDRSADNLGPKSVGLARAHRGHSSYRARARS